MRLELTREQAAFLVRAVDRRLKSTNKMSEKHADDKAATVAIMFEIQVGSEVLSKLIGSAIEE